MADKRLLTNDPSINDPSLSFVQPTYSGFQNKSHFRLLDSVFSNSLVKIGLIGYAGKKAYEFHKNKLETSETYLPKLQKIVRNFEEFSPHKMGRTFALGERLSSYATPDVINYTEKHLIAKSGGLTPLGDHLQRQFGSRFDVLTETGEDGLSFTKKAKNSVYHTFDQAKGINLSFVDSKGHLAGASYRLNKPLAPRPINWVHRDGLFDNIKGNFKAIRDSQTPKKHPGGFDYNSAGIDFLPYHTTFDVEEGASRFARYKNTAKNVISGAELEGFGPVLGIERGQKLLSEIGVGLNQGTYNKIFTIPFFAKEGERGFVNELMLKRVLPVAIGLTALKYADYLTGHIASNTLINIPLKANVARAELTDRLPGARAVTDTYSKVVPGAQYGPLALPLGGAAIGGLLHYSKVLRNKYADQAARDLGSKLLPDLKFLKNVKNLEGLKTGLQSAWKGLGAPGKGLIAGLGLMLPFIPGMLGSRKTARQLKDIYSGEQDVPVRSGRFWSLGVSPFSGTRITAWRPHWSVLYKAHAKEASLYGSEKNYWANSPILHPFRYLRDPYKLEKMHYEDRPYPITSPAFSNVPLVGPLLAATIGKLIKPVKRMHEDEFDEREYNMYSTRLNPKGPTVESKFERDILHDLSKLGYNTKTQVKQDNYRIDFVVEGEKGRKLAIEADGDTYHKIWNEAKDARRQKELESKGWDFFRIRSTPYFQDPNKVMASIVAELNRKGIKPTLAGDNNRDLRSGLIGLAPPIPKEEFGFGHILKEETEIFADFIGLPGYLAKTVYEKIFPNKEKGKDAYLQGSRQMDSLSRSYYDANIGEGLGPNISGETGTFGFTEPLRRFVQRDRTGEQVNDIANTMPSWLPGEDYLTNFRTGDPYTKISQGFARLPGDGFAALHPELQGVNPEDYPDIAKLKILSDVAPYSREFNLFKDKVYNSLSNEEDKITYEKIIDQAQQTRDSILQIDKRRFTGDTDEIKGTVKYASTHGVELSEYPGRLFKYSSLGMSGADLSAIVLGQHNSLSRSDVAQEVVNRQKAAQDYIASTLKQGTSVNLVVSKGAADNSEQVSAVISANGTNINKYLLDEGYAQFNKKYGGAESGHIFGLPTRVLGKLAETASFVKDTPGLVKLLPSSYHTKLWQERSAIAQYTAQEVVGTRMRRWDRPIDDFIEPYLRSTLSNLTGKKFLADVTVQRRDLDTLADQLKYLRGLHNIAEGQGDEYTRDIRRTNIGTNLLASPIYVASTIPDRDKRYFQPFLAETDPKKRVEILKITPPELAKSLQAQWAAADARIKTASGKDPGIVQEQGRVVTEENLKDYSKANTKLGYGDYLRSKEVADFFSRTGFALPENGDSEIFSNNIDYEDVKLKIIQNEGYDAHDFNIFDDRTAMLWRKPYIEGAVSAITSGDKSQSSEQIRRSVEQLILNANNQNKNPKASIVTQATRINKNSVKMNISVDQQEKMMKDIRRNPEDYKQE